MLPQRPLELNGIVCSTEEHLAILGERLAVLEAATGEGRLGGPLPVRWRSGWTCRFKVVRRDSQGALLVELRAWHVRTPKQVYVRRRRFVQQTALPYELGKRLRED